VPSLGRDFFPQVDAGQIRLHMRARTGLRIEETARLAAEVDGITRQTIGADVVTLIDNVGLPYSGLNLSYSNAGTLGTQDAEIMGQLKPDHRVPPSQYVSELRKVLADREPGIQFFFQPADIVSQILNFGT